MATAIAEANRSPEFIENEFRSKQDALELKQKMPWNVASECSKVEQFLSKSESKLTDILAAENVSSGRLELRDECKTIFKSCLMNTLKFNAKNSRIMESEEFLARLYVTVLAITTTRNKLSISLHPQLLKRFGVSEIGLMKTVKILQHCLKASSDLDVSSDELLKLKVDIVQHLLWQRGSALWDILTKTDGFVPAFEDVKDQSSTSSTTNFAKIEIRQDDCGKECDTTGVCDIAVTGTSDQRRADCDKIISFVFRQVYGYAFSRTEELCRMLHVLDNLQDIWDGVNYALTKCCRELLWGRDLDLILLCFAYGVTKGKTPGNPLEFRKALQCYKKLPNSNHNINECIHLEQIRSPGHVHNNVQTEPSSNCSKPTGNLVDYYNRIFLPAVKPFFKSHIRPCKGGSNTPKPCSPMPGNYNSPVRVAGNIYVSPLRDPLPSSPRCLEYKFASTSQPDGGLRSINDMLKNNSPTVKRQSTQADEFTSKHAKKISFSGKDHEQAYTPKALPR